MSDFERRHEERFEGDAFDWYPFRQDGQRFPARDPRERPATEVFVEPADGSAPARQLTRLGVPAVGGNVQWTPDGRALVFMANEGASETTYGEVRPPWDTRFARVAAEAHTRSGWILPRGSRTALPTGARGAPSPPDSSGGWLMMIR